MGQPGYFFSRLLYTSAAVAAPLLALTAYTLYRDHQVARDEAVRTVQTQALAAANQLDDVFDRSERLLVYVASQAESGLPSAPQCGDFIRGLQAVAKPIANVGVVTLRGDVICSSLKGPSAANANVSAAAWFQQAAATDGFVLSKPLLGRVSDKWVVMLSMAARDAAGHKNAVAGLSLDLDDIGLLVAWAGSPVGGTLAIVDKDSTFMYRAPDNRQWTGKTTPALALVRAVGGRTGTYTARGADDVERIFAFAATSHHELTVVAGIPVEVAFAKSGTLIRQGTLIAAAITLFAALVAYATARSLARPVRSLASTVRNNAGGGTQARADESLPGEFGLLAAEVNTMLEALSRSEARAEASEHAALRLARFYKALSDTNQAIVRLARPHELFETICRVCVDSGQASMAWVGELRAGKLVPVAWGGPARQYTDSFESEIGTQGPSPNGPSMTAALAGQVCVANDFLNDPRTLPWRRHAAPFGVRASIAVPFQHGGVVGGTLNLYATEVGFFDEQLVELLQEMATDLAFALDNIERIEAHERAVLQIAKRDAQLSGIVESVADAIISVDASHRIVVFNEAAVRMFGVPAAQASGQELNRFIPGRYREMHDLHLDTFAKGASDARPMGCQRDLKGLRCDGTEFPLVASISRTGQDGDVLMTAVVRDITGERAAEHVRLAAAEAQAANRAKTAFLSRMSHELRTPLNAVLGFTQLLQEDAKGRLNKREQHRLDLVFLAGVQMQALLDDVLDVSRIESGNMALAIRDVHLRNLLEGVMRMCEVAARAARVKLRLRYASDGPIDLRTDPVRLRQVMLNLLTNAIKYNRPGGSVSLSVEAVDGAVRITVADTGLGMSREQLAELFQPFNRLGREQSDISGTGLGMSLARQLVELMGGSIDVASEVGSATVVRVQLPMARQPETLPTKADSGASTPPRLGDAGREPSGVILYIEDNAVNVLLVEQILGRWPDVRLVIAEDGRTGIQQALLLKPDVVLLDMGLPDMSGLEVLKTLRSDPRTSDLCIVALSGSAMQEEVSAALAAGAQEYWTKPIVIQPFLEGLLAVLPAGHAVTETPS
jgi:PAS domain S-box-containing protein